MMITHASTFRLIEGPFRVWNADPDPSADRYEAHFSTSTGDEIPRLLTDRGRAHLMRFVDDGRRVFSIQELQEFTVSPKDRRRVDRVDPGYRSTG